MNESPPSLRGAQATKQSSFTSRLYGLLRGACHRARMRATRWKLLMSRLSDHQHVEDDDRRQAQDHRPDAERPEDVRGRKTLSCKERPLRIHETLLFREWILLPVHNAPAFLVLAGTLIRLEL